MVIILWQNTTNLIVLLPFLPIINQGYYDDYEYIYIYEYQTSNYSVEQILYII